MTRLLGAALVAGCGVWMGLQRTVWYTRRVETLQALLQALSLMEWELAGRETPLPELLRRLERETRGPVQRFFAACGEQLSSLGQSPFGALWEAAEAQVQLPLDREERSVLLEIGQVLGRYDQESQRQAISRSREQLAARLEQARAERERLGRLAGIVGASAGLITVLLLI